MTESTIPQPALADAHLYVRARWLFVLAIASLMLLDAPYPGGEGEVWLHAFLVGVLLAGSAVLTWTYERQGLDGLVTAMRWVLFPDLFGIAGLTYLLIDMQVGFFPIVVLFPAVYALIMPNKRDAWLTGVGVSAAYFVGHVIAHPWFDLGETVVNALGIVVINVLAVLVSASVERRRAREEETREAVAQREQALAQTQRRVAELQAVSQITETIHSSLDFDRVGPLVLDILSKVIGIDTCCVFVIDKAKSETLFTASIGAIGDVPAGEYLQPGSSTPDGHFSCIAPFDHADAMVLFCAEAQDIDSLSEEDRLVLNAVASELVVAVENSRLYKLTKRLAITDELTGLANYRHLQSRIDREIERARRYEKHFSLLMLDVDDFKSFNDEEGHIAGDAALADLARVMERAVREVDLVARYGGEEFSFVLPETDAAGAFVVAEKIREAVADHEFPNAEGVRGCRLTVSVGLASYPVHGVTRESLLREADDALYRAKNGGKNRVRTPRRNQKDEAPAEQPAPDAEAAPPDPED